MKFDTVEKILDFAIEKEEEAAELYTGLANKMTKPYMKLIFEQFAREEKGHKAKLEMIKVGKIELPPSEKITDLKIAEIIVDVDIDGELDYQQALIAAMKAEKAAFKLYSDLAEIADHQDTKQLFLSLAQEEAKHKLRFEVEYDENVFSEN